MKISHAQRPHRLTCLCAQALVLVAVLMVLTTISSAQTRSIELYGNLDFGRVPFGASSERLLEIVNTGRSSVLNISNLDYPTLPPFDQVSFQGNWSGPIAPRSIRYVVIRFKPLGTALGGTNNLDFHGLLTVESDATRGTNTIAMSGVGIWQPTNHLPVVDFGTVAMGASRVVACWLTNRGSVPITISNILLPDDSWEGYRGGRSNSIAAGSSVNLFMQFSPTNTGTQGGLLTITSDAREPSLVVITRHGNNTNSAESFNQIIVTGNGNYPAGKWIGLFAPTNKSAFDNSGYFKATCTAKGKFRGTITLAGKRYPFSAQVSSSGAAFATIVRKKLNSLHISLQCIVDNGVYWQGTIDDGVWTAELKSTVVNSWTGGGSGGSIGGGLLPGTLPFGSYAITIAGSTNSSTGPMAAGHGTLTVKPPNRVRITGDLGDGTRFSRNAGYSDNFPFYTPLYYNRGAILGWISTRVILDLPPPIGLPRSILTNVPIVLETISSPPFTNVPPIDITPIEIKSSVSNSASALEHTYKIIGNLDWFKPGGIDPDYPEGFSFQTTVTGSFP